MLAPKVKAQFANAEPIKFNSLTHDFGTIKENDGEVSFSFSFKNNENKPLLVTKVKTSCGCTSPDWTKNPVAKNGSGFVKATYNPKNRPGGFSKSLTVYYTVNNKSKTKKLTIKGDVVK